MILPLVRRVLKENLLSAGEPLPKWVDSLLSPINLFMEQVTQALRNNLSLVDNFSGKSIQLVFTNDVEQRINPLTTRRIYGALVVASESQMVTGVYWRMLDTGEVGITLRFAGGGAETSKCTIFLLFGG